MYSLYTSNAYNVVVIYLTKIGLVCFGTLCMLQGTRILVFFLWFITAFCCRRGGRWFPSLNLSYRLLPCFQTLVIESVTCQDIGRFNVCKGECERVLSASLFNTTFTFNMQCKQQFLLQNVFSQLSNLLSDEDLQMYSPILRYTSTTMYLLI